jgi:hypothetical protein
MDQAPSTPTAEPSWIPLGSAQIIDWKYLGHPPGARGATAWAGRIAREPVLVRASTEEATTTFEFLFLAHEALAGAVKIATSRPDPHRVRMEVAVEVPGRLAHSESHELAEHPRTGLFGATVRTVEGDLPAEALPELGALEGEIFEFAPESALSTLCGRWLLRALEAVRRAVLDGEHEAEAEPEPPAPVSSREGRRAREPEPELPRVEPRPEPRYERPEPRVERPEPRVERAAARPEPRLDRPEPRPEPRMSAPAPVSAPARKRVQKLLVSTSSGESWEVTDPETYIGRSKQCAIVLKSQRVSRRHASITLEEDGFYLNDLGAANGIWAGTEKIEREKLDDGCEYIVGDVLLTFALA